MSRTVGKRLAIALQMGAAALTVLAAALLWRGGWPASAPIAADGAAARLALAARWLLAPAFTLFAGIAAIAAMRLFSARAMEGGETGQGRFVDITLRYNRNTLEQTMLAAVAWAGLALALPAAELTLIPKLAVLFVIGRVIFWMGYLFAPWARAYGFALTFYPTAIALVWLALKIS